MRSVAFTPDGNTLATGGEDGVLNLWHTATGQPLGQLMSEPADINQILFDSDGLILAGQLSNDSVVIYDATPNGSPNAQEPPHSVAKFHRLGDLPGGEFESIPMNVSTDGRFVVGWSSSTTGRDAFRWSWAEGMRPFKVRTGYSRAEDVSDDGRIFTGNAHKNRNWRGHRWTVTGEAELVGPPSSVAVAMTPDGSHVVGRYWTDDHWNAFRWSHGSSELPSSPDHRNAEAVAVSSNGQLVLGWVYNYVGVKDLRHNRYVSTIGISDARPVIWDNEGLKFLPGFDADKLWWPAGMSDDGSVIVGVGWPPDVNLCSNRQLSGMAFRWEAGRTQMLGILENYKKSFAQGISGDGRLVVGSYFRHIGDRAVGTGFIWDANRGLRAANEVLAEAGASLRGVEIGEVVAISSDGSTIVGRGKNPRGFREGWLARLPNDLMEGVQAKPPATTGEQKTANK